MARDAVVPVAAAGAGVTLDEPSTLGRAALAISGWNALSRLTGFVRVVAVGGALGTTFLGNTYQSANLVSTVTFELLAAGLLSAPLVPTLVGLVERGKQADAVRLAGSLLGASLLALGALVLVLSAAGHAVMRLLTATVPDAEVRDQQVRLGSFLLWFFLPQMLLYAVGAVASAFLHARRRFAAAAAAPVANNVVVTATMVAFTAVGPGGRPGLDLGLVPRLVLAVGTTAGVLAMVAVPVVALARAGVRIRPRLDLRHPELGRVLRDGAWGAALLAGAQVLVGVTMVLANAVEGGVVAFQIAFTFFLLPFALVAHPVLTALHPRLASHANAGRWRQFGVDLGAGMRRTLLVVVPAAALLAGLAGPVLELVRLGALDAAGARLVSSVLTAYAVGLPGYAGFHLLARAATAAGHTRVAALVGVGVTVGGAALMTAASRAASGDARVVTLALGYSVAVSAGAVVLWRLLQARIARPLVVAPTLARASAAAGAAWVAATVAGRLVGVDGRLGAGLEVGLAAPLAIVTTLVVLALLGEPELPRRRAPGRRTPGPQPGDTTTAPDGDGDPVSGRRPGLGPRPGETAQ